METKCVQAAKSEINGSSRSGGKKKFYVCVEGVKHEWNKETISTGEIAGLGGWDVAQGVIEIDKDNNERTLVTGEIVDLKPGQGFAKKVCWKRGLYLMQERIEAELLHLKRQYANLEYNSAGQWVLVPGYTFGEGWSPQRGDVAFQIPENGFPGTPPYGIYVTCGLKFQGRPPNNYREPSPNQPPFEGTWGILSWAPVDGSWRPGTSIVSGANLLNWVNGFSARFKEGV